jgi:hypothetical protein
MADWSHYGRYGTSACSPLAAEHNITAVERAFQIARSGGAASVEEIRWALYKEGHLAGFIEGSSIRLQLSRLLREGQAARETAGRNKA